LSHVSIRDVNYVSAECRITGYPRFDVDGWRQLRILCKPCGRHRRNRWCLCGLQPLDRFFGDCASSAQSGARRANLKALVSVLRRPLVNWLRPARFTLALPPAHFVEGRAGRCVEWSSVWIKV
jgi:hypothetical protein